MAYGQAYSLPFLNREQVSCEVKFYSNDDYAGPITTLTGSGKPFELSYQAQDNQMPYGLRPSEAIIEFYAGSLSLVDFYNEADNFWKVEFYKNSVLEWTGFLQLDNCSEAFTDIDHIISLNANDGLARLQALYLLEDQSDPNRPAYRSWTLQDLFSYIFAFIGSSLNIAVYLNIFENTTDDRQTDPTADMIQQTAIDTSYYINDDGTTMNLYDILNNILTDLRSWMLQATGEWVIVRPGDIRLFDDGTMPGTRYLGGWGSFETCVYPAAIDIGRNLTIIPINENQQTKILRPFAFAKETFNFNQHPYIQNANLLLPDGATPFATNTVDDIRYDDYDIATYFSAWTEIGTADVQFLRVETDVSGPIETEIDRYIVSQFGNAVSGIQFNPITVTKGDILDFSLRFRTDNDVSGTLRFYIKIALVEPDCTITGIFAELPGDLSYSIVWSATGFSFLIYLEPDTSTGSTTDWIDLHVVMAASLGNLRDQPIPADGMLLIDVYGTNGTSDHDDYTTYWKDVQLNIYNFADNSFLSTGQVHNTIQSSTIKNNEQIEVSHDDSPRNSILGTLFTNAVTTFCEDIGGKFFTRTSDWHRATIIEDKKLGQLNTGNDLFIQKQIRTIMEGDFFGLTDVSMSALVKFVDLDTGKNFIFGVGRFDYMACIWNATLYELFDDDERDFNIHNILDVNDINDSYSSTGVSIAIQFTNVVTNEAFTPNGGFDEFTYNGSNGLVGFDFSAEGYWRTAKDATMNLNINGVSIGSYHVGTGSAFYFFRAGIQLDANIANGDVVSVTLDWSGSTSYTLDLDDNALRVNVNIPESVGDYTFNYIYNTQ